MKSRIFSLKIIAVLYFSISFGVCEAKAIQDKFSVKIKILQDVKVNPENPIVDKNGKYQSGQIFADPDESFILKTGTIISATDEISDGCEFRVDKKIYKSMFCVWTSGFTDHQSDFFEVLGKKKLK